MPVLPAGLGRYTPKNWYRLCTIAYMKYLYIMIATVLLMAASSTEPDKSLANVNRVKGVLVYTDSYPVAKYKTIGNVKSITAGSNQYEPVRDKLIHKAKKEFDNVDGIILYLNNGKADNADVIRFE